MDELVNVEAGATSPSVNKFSTAYRVDAAGIVKYDCIDTDGSVITKIEQVAASVWNNANRISKVYKYYTGTTTVTGKVYGSGGTLVEGIVIR